MPPRDDCWLVVLASSGGRRGPRAHNSVATGEKGAPLAQARPSCVQWSGEEAIAYNRRRLARVRRLMRTTPWDAQCGMGSVARRADVVNSDRRQCGRRAEAQCDHHGEALHAPPVWRACHEHHRRSAVRLYFRSLTARFAPIARLNSRADDPDRLDRDARAPA
jgi:hypothetical protein